MTLHMPFSADSAPDPVAVIVSAGRGSRLLPLTAARPKCLVAVGGRAILDHQLDALADAGVRHAVVVAGYRAEQVADHVARGRHSVDTRFLFNPFWSVASSIGSVWAAREFVKRPFLLLNGDTVFEGAVIRDALDRAAPGVNLVVERPDRFDIDDMRVAMDGGRVNAVAKDLDIAAASHRSLGLIISKDRDGGGYHDALRRVIGAENGVQAYHHDIVDLMARTGVVNGIVADGDWCEIDRPEDIAAWQRVHPEFAIGQVA